MPAFVESPSKPAFSFAQERARDSYYERMAHFQPYSPSISAGIVGAALSAPSTESSSGELPRQITTSDYLSSSGSSTTSSAIGNTPRSYPIAFHGWRDCRDFDDGDVKQQDTQRFPTSYLRHRCASSVVDTHEQPNNVWSALAKGEAIQITMMKEDVDVKIECVDSTIHSQDEAGFWRVSGPGFVWRQKSEVSDYPMCDA